MTPEYGSKNSPHAAWNKYQSILYCSLLESATGNVIPSPAEDKSPRGKKRIRDYRNDLFVSSFGGHAKSAPGATFHIPSTYIESNLFVSGSYAIGCRESIIYLGNYSEAGSTPVARGPQIIECKLSLFSATRKGVLAERGSLNPLYNPP